MNQSLLSLFYKVGVLLVKIFECGDHITKCCFYCLGYRINVKNQTLLSPASMRDGVTGLLYDLGQFYMRGDEITFGFS